MVFTETELKGAYIIDIEQLEDERGFFARAFSKEEFEKHGLYSEIIHCNLSHNKKKGTIRGMHYQINPYEEVKIVRCLKGRIVDIIIDLRKDSETYLKWFSVELNQYNKRALYVPKFFAHGYQTLEDDTEVFYMTGEIYNKDSERGIRWNDQKVDIDWPIKEGITISEKDSNIPLI